MKVSVAKLGVLAAVATVLVLFAAMRSGIDTPVAEADIATPGGISALPSAAPGLPGIANQGIPAIIPADEPGRGSATGIGGYNKAIVTVFCDRADGADAPFNDDQCASFEEANAEEGAGGPITLKMVQVSGDGSLASSFNATGTDTLVCRDNAPCDLHFGGGFIPTDDFDEGAAQPQQNQLGGAVGIVAVLVDGGPENEVIKVTATDDVGEARSVLIVVVDTILAWGETGAVSTASQETPVFISYACDDTGARPLNALEMLVEESMASGWGGSWFDGVAGLDDMWDLMYGGGWSFDFGPLDNNALGDVDIPLLQCGGDTQGSLFDDFVDFETTLGFFSFDPVGLQIQLAISDILFAFGIFTPPSLDFDCGEGKDVDGEDINGMAVWSIFLALFDTEGGCDADFAGNGVATYMLLGTGQAGVAEIDAQQGGGVSPPRHINVTFVGEAGLSLFITAPDTIGLLGDEFTVTVTDSAGRPIGNETVECTVDPAGGALAIIPQTGTTGDAASDHPGLVSFDLIPTGASVLGGEELTIKCVLDRDRSVSASTTVTLSTTPLVEAVDLVAGCNFVSWTGADGTEPADLAAGVAPEDILAGIWAQQPAPDWAGYNPEFPEVSDLGPVDQLDVIAVCVTDVGTFTRPVI